MSCAVRRTGPEPTSPVGVLFSGFAIVRPPHSYPACYCYYGLVGCARQGGCGLRRRKRGKRSRWANQSPATSSLVLASQAELGQSTGMHQAQDQTKDSMLAYGDSFFRSIRPSHAAPIGQLFLKPQQAHQLRGQRGFIACRLPGPGPGPALNHSTSTLLA
jgi:hypothetical protein